MGRHSVPLIILLTQFVVICTLITAEASALKEGKRLYDEGRYGESAAKFREALNEDPDSDVASFDLGAALYKSGKYAEAAEAFSRALDTDNKKLEADAVYNIGNARYMLGRAQAGSNPQAAVSLYQDALQHYKRAIELDRSNRDARYNHELVERELKVLLDRIKNQPPPQEGDSGKKQDRKQEQKAGDSGPDKEDSQQKREKRSDKDGKEGDREKQQRQQGRQNAGQAKDKAGDEREMSPEEARMLLDAFGEQGTLSDLSRAHRGTVPEAVKDW
jgi:tetratricopeptide (TPR) repeat protein